MRFDKLKTFLLLKVLLSFFCMVTLSYADTLDTQLSSDQVALGETLTVSFNLSSHSNNITPDFSPLEKDFRILGTNYGNAINNVNGITTTQTFWQLTVEPLRTGEITVPAINFGNVRSAERKLVVIAAPNRMINDKPDAQAFLQAEINTTKPYIQSQVLYSLKIFFQTQLENPRIEVPQIKDATFVQLDEGNQYQTILKGKPFTVIEKKFAIFPQKPGKISIPPFHFRALTYDLNPNSMDDFFSINTPKVLSLATQDFTLNIQKIPDQFQGPAWLPAKNIALTEKWSANLNQWELGDPVTRTITVKAQGLRAEQIPDLSIEKISGVNIYVDSPKRSNSVLDNAVIGTLEQKVTYIPNATQFFTIPALKLKWWNTQTNQNALAQLNSITIQVIEKPNNLASTLANQNSKTFGFDNQSPDNVVKATALNAKVKTNPFYFSIWFWIATFLFALWLITLWFFWTQKSAKTRKSDFFKQDESTVPNSPELNDKSFKRACEEGNRVLAQQFLLSWSKNQLQDVPPNLEKLSDIIGDEDFKNALKELVQALYGKNHVTWNGRALLTAYHKVKKQRKHAFTKLAPTTNAQKDQDPLPPLNP